MSAPRQPSGGDEWRFTSRGARWNAKLRVAAVAARQHGRIAWQQLRGLEIAEATICGWVADGYLHRVLPRVYAVGHAARSAEADLVAALLYAGPGAMLSHATAVWWRGWLKFPPPQIHVSTPRRVSAPHPRIVVHGRRSVPRAYHRGLPITDPARTLLDFATTAEPERLRFVLANADFDDLLVPEDIDRLTGRGIDGTVNIQAALAAHRPQLAFTRSELERRMIALAEANHLPLPRCNVHVHGHLVDAVWDAPRVVVELDGHQGHRTAAQLRADHRRDLELRLQGYIVLRYTWDQVTLSPALVAADIRRALVRAKLVELAREL